MNFLDLHGHRVDLLAVSENGLANMHEYSVKPEFYRYFEYGPFKTVQDTKRYLKKLIELSNSKSGHYWFIKLKAEDKIIGTLGIINIDLRRYSGELGFGLSPDYWGCGYFHESLLMALRYLFVEINIHRISAKTQSNNMPSIKALKRAGFKKEGVMRDFYLSSNGKRYDAILLSIIRNEFSLNFDELKG